MRKLLSKYPNATLTLLLGLLVFLFWRFRYPFALTYQEQFQLFLFDGDYLCDRLSEPGGLARYLGEFLTQFYNSVTLGALILAALYMLTQRLTWRLMTHGRWAVAGGTAHYALSFLPAVLLWYAMGEENIMLSYVVALILAMLAMLAAPRRKYLRWAYVLIGIPLLYWLIGPLTLLVALYVMPLSAVYALAWILLSARLLPYPLSRLMQGLSYYRFPEASLYILAVIPALILLLAYAVRWLPKAKAWVAGCEAAVVFVALVPLAATLGFDTVKYDLIEYDYLVRVKDWDGVIAKSEKKMPTLPMSVCATNLALAMNNQLGDRIFDFYQRGVEGLLMPFERSFTSPLIPGEVYFNLGLVNTAQRFVFEAMESLPNYNKSGRVMKRLVETNLINGQYDVALKYIEMLEKTIFYRPWAKRTRALLGDEKQIDGHPLYGWLRQIRLEEDFLFSDQEIDKICGQLFIHNPQNQMAAQYLLMAPLLDRDIPRFMQYVQVVQSSVRYNPKACQEGIAFAYMQRGQQPPQGAVGPLVMSRIQDFGRLYSAGGKDAPGLAQYGNTAWYYLTVGR